MSHQRVFPDWKWNISKFQFWRQILDIYRQPLLKKVNVMMEDVFICIGLRQDVGDFQNQTDWPDLNLNWLFDYCFYYFTAWLSRFMYMFCFLFTFFPSHDFGCSKAKKCGRTQYASARGAGTLLYQLCRYVLPHRVGFLRRFGLKMSIHFANFALESGMVFEGSTGVHERIYRFNSKWVRKNEKYANSKCIWRIFCLRSNLSNDNVISA